MNTMKINCTTGSILKLNVVKFCYEKFIHTLFKYSCNFCDFVLYSAEGPPSIQRIYRNKTSAFWHRVFFLEYFEMHVPRDLEPFILH